MGAIYPNLNPALQAALATFDPGSEHAVGHLWGTTGIGYDARQLQALAPDAPTDSWRLAFDPDVVASTACCGVSIVSAPRDVIGAALIAQGRDPDAITEASVAEANKLLLGIRTSVSKTDSDSQIGDLVGPNGNLRHERRTGTHARQGSGPRRRLQVRHPPGRRPAMVFDSLAIPTGSPHRDEAHELIDFLMSPGVAARNANYVGQATVNAAAMPMIDAALRNDPGIYPPAEVLARLVPLRGRTQEESRLENRVWTRFRGGP